MFMVKTNEYAEFMKISNSLYLILSVSGKTQFADQVNMLKYRILFLFNKNL